MLMLTGARLGEVMGTQWREFDDDAQLWTIPPQRFKMNAQHFVPVTDELSALLETIPHWTQGDHLFSSTSGAQPVRFNDRAIDKLRERGWCRVALVACTTFAARCAHDFLRYECRTRWRK